MVVSLLNDGGAGVLPTDTIYGLSCRALDKMAVERVHQIKSRDSQKPFIVLISNLKMLDLLSISPQQSESVRRYWPGALSVIFRTSRAPVWLQRGTYSLAVRMPDYPELLELIDKVGPLISTSANFQGQPPVHSVPEARTVFGDRLDFYVDAGWLDNPASTLVKLDDGKLQVIRQGAVRIEP